MSGFRKVDLGLGADGKLRVYVEGRYFKDLCDFVAECSASPVPGPAFSDDFNRADGPLGIDWITPFLVDLDGANPVVYSNKMVTPTGQGWGATRTAQTFAPNRSVMWTMGVTDQSVNAPSFLVLRGSDFSEEDYTGDVYQFYLANADSSHQAPIIRSGRNNTLPYLFNGPTESASWIPNANTGRNCVSFVTIGSDTQITWEYWNGTAWVISAQILATGPDSFIGGGWIGLELVEGQSMDDFVVVEI